MAHAFVFGVMYDGNIFRAMSSQTPLWFNEGLAEVLSSGWNREADMFMLDRVLNSSVPPPGPMLDGYLAYKGGQSFLYYLYSTGGDSLFNAMLREFKFARNAERAIERAYKQSLADLGRDWLSELRRIYWPEIGRRSEPRRHAKPVTVHTKDRSRFNVRPRVSPDGKSVAFFSDKNDYVRIIITDAKGRELRQIGQHSLSGSFESFQPFNGAIAWSPDSRELAFIAKKGGRNEIRVVNAKTGRTREAVRLPLSAINGLDWSKDGKKLALTAISYGQTDLYLYDFETFELDLLTDSHEAKSSPRFSPDGKKIIFAVTDTAGLGTGPLPAPPAPPVTDPPPPKTPPSKKTKQSSKAPPAKTQPPPPPKATAPPPSTAAPDTSSTIILNPRPASNIAIFDIGENRWDLLTDTKWNDKQPAFSPDGKSFIFVSDRNGVDNLYIASIDNPGNPRPLTDYAGSCGNPDWAADGSAIVYDNFMNQAWNVWRMEKPLDKIISDSALAPTRWAEHEEDPSIPFFIKRSFADTNNVDDSINTASGGTANDSTAAANAGDTAKSKKDRGKSKNPDRRNLDDYPYSYRGDRFDDPFYPYESRRYSRDERAGADALVTVDTMPGPRPYTLRFSPDLVIVGLGVSTYSGASGQALVSFSDVMGDHRVTVVGDLQAEFNDYAQVYAAYEYMKLRFNVTVGGFYYKYYSFAYDGQSGRYFHDLETGGFLGLSYPFSMFSRADLQILNRYMERTPLTGSDPAALEYNALLAVTGYSFDNILWGITGPLRGVRASARLQLAPPLSFTSEAYLSGDIDVRHYTHLMKRFVWANRLTAGATVGLDGNPAARRFFLGGDANWFNYGVNMENYYNNLAYSYYSDIVAPLRGWNYFDITGDRMLLMNSEFRFPFIREISTVWPIPMQIRYINGAMFIDAGYAWTRDEQNEKLPPLPPKIVGGYGFGMRANLGIFVLRYDRGWPTDWKSTGGPVNYFSLGAEF
jgi:Tol biopolymer transport system component